MAGTITDRSILIQSEAGKPRVKMQTTVFLARCHAIHAMIADALRPWIVAEEYSETLESGDTVTSVKTTIRRRLYDVTLDACAWIEDGRTCEVWESIFCLARHFGLSADELAGLRAYVESNQTVVQAIQIGKQARTIRKMDGDAASRHGLQALRVLATLAQKYPDAKGIPTANVVTIMRQSHPDMTPETLALLLRPFGIGPIAIRFHAGVRKAYPMRTILQAVRAAGIVMEGAK
jgi:hypothetical protein